MDVVYTNSSGIDVGVLTHFSIDYEESTEKGKNTFQIKISDDVPIELGSFVYANGTAYGGRVTKVDYETKSSKATFTGKTWLGLFEDKIITNDMTVSGDLNVILSTLISNCGLGAYFNASTSTSHTISNYKIEAYTSLFDAVIRMLSTNGYKLKMTALDGKIEVSAIPVTDFQDTAEINSDLFSFKITRQKYTCNHIIAISELDTGEILTANKYIQSDGTIGNNQYYFGVDEVAELTEQSAKTIEELQEKAIEQLDKKAVDDGLKITAYDLNADICDKVTAVDMRRNISITQFVTNKIATINDNFIKYQYKVGDTI